MKTGALKKKKVLSWCSPPCVVLKFNVDGAAKGKGIGSILRTHVGEVSYMFSKYVGIRDSNKAEVMTNLETLCIYHTSFHHYFIVEIDLLNAISWVKR